MQRGQCTDAEWLEVRALETKMSVLRPEHPATLGSMTTVASILQRRGRTQEARVLQEQAVESRNRREALKEHDRGGVTGVANAASSSTGMECRRHAQEQTVHSAQSGSESGRGIPRTQPIAIPSSSNRGVPARQTEDAWPHAPKTAKSRWDAQRSQADTLASLADLAWSWYQSGDVDQAIVLLTGCHELRRQKLGEHHPDTFACREAIKNWRMSNKGLL